MPSINKPLFINFQPLHTFSDPYVCLVKHCDRFNTIISENNSKNFRLFGLRTSKKVLEAQFCLYSWNAITFNQDNARASPYYQSCRYNSVYLVILVFPKYGANNVYNIFQCVSPHFVTSQFPYRVLLSNICNLRIQEFDRKESDIFDGRH